MPHISSVPVHYAPLLPLEEQLLNAVRTITEHARQTIDVMAEPAQGNRVGAQFLRWLLLEALPQTGQPIAQLRLSGARITGNLDVSGRTLSARLGFRTCEFDRPIVLTEATLVRSAQETAPAS